MISLPHRYITPHRAPKRNTEYFFGKPVFHLIGFLAVVEMVDLLLRARADETVVDIQSVTARDKAPGICKTLGSFLWTSSLNASGVKYDVLPAGACLDRVRGNRVFRRPCSFKPLVRYVWPGMDYRNVGGDSRLFIVAFLIGGHRRQIRSV